MQFLATHWDEFMTILNTVGLLVVAKAKENKR